MEQLYSEHLILTFPKLFHLSIFARIKPQNCILCPVAVRYHGLICQCQVPSFCPCCTEKKVSSNFLFFILNLFEKFISWRSHLSPNEIPVKESCPVSDMVSFEVSNLSKITYCYRNYLQRLLKVWCSFTKFFRIFWRKLSFTANLGMFLNKKSERIFSIRKNTKLSFKVNYCAHDYCLLKVCCLISVKKLWNFIHNERIGIEIWYDTKPYNLLKGDRLVSYHMSA